MDPRLTRIAATRLEGAETGAMTFPDIVATLVAAGVESYAVDLRRASATYTLPDDQSVVLPTQRHAAAIAPALDRAAVTAAIRDAQALVPGYTYAGFCERVMRAGCVGYVVSFSGCRAVYLGRDAQTLVEPFPPA